MYCGCKMNWAGAYTHFLSNINRSGQKTVVTLGKKFSCIPAIGHVYDISIPDRFPTVGAMSCAIFGTISMAHFIPIMAHTALCHQWHVFICCAIFG